MYIVPYDPNVLQEVVGEWLKQIHVDVVQGAVVKSIDTNERRITGLALETSDGVHPVSVRSVIDATGNSAIAAMAGEAMMREPAYQSAAQVFRIAGIPSVEAFTLSLAISKAMLRDGDGFPDSYRRLTLVPGSLHGGQVDLKLPLPHTVDDNEDSIASISADMQTTIPSVVAWLRDHVQLLNNTSLTQIFPRVGVRVRQRPHGKQVLTEADVMTVKRQPDGIAVGTWPIEEWDYAGKVSMKYFELDRGYDIAAGCLRAQNTVNLYYAGKCISATTAAIASARVMGTCLQTGFAAGRLAVDDSAHTLQLLRHELVR
ncbi:MAG: FAD-dependent oxidoreductase [Bacteroidia bacterium]|nr:FAD-dependent oxidoreductase [Bacteroidia bacterium]